MVEVTLFENPKGFQLVHLVNGSGHFGVTFYEPVTMRDLEVVIPYEGQPSSVHSLVDDQPLSYIPGDGRLTIRVPRLELFQAIKIVP